MAGLEDVNATVVVVDNFLRIHVGCSVGWLSA